MAIDFPNSPAIGDTYTTGGRTWQWDGTTWKSYGNYPDPTVLKIDPATNRVGINNTSPTVTLDVTGDTKVSGNLAVGTVTDVETGITDLQAGATATSIKVYADASARTTAVPSPAAGDLSFLTSTASVEVYDGSAWVSVGGATMIKKGRDFTASTTWTVPSGVTFVMAHLKGGGGGLALATTGTGGTGGTTTVASSGGSTTSALGGVGMRMYGNNPYWNPTAGRANSGAAARTGWDFGMAHDGVEKHDGFVVSGGDTLTITIGAGGSAGSSGAAGGSGYVWIEYMEEA